VLSKCERVHKFLLRSVFLRPRPLFHRFDLEIHREN
jgi:hypothetical protein